MGRGKPLEGEVGWNVLMWPGYAGAMSARGCSAASARLLAGLFVASVVLAGSGCRGCAGPRSDAAPSHAVLAACPTARRDEG